LLLLWTDYCNRQSLTRTLSVPVKPIGAWASLSRVVLWFTAIVTLRRWWLLTPVLALLLALTGLSFLGQSATIAPFIYMLF
jgi:hypothetical protein